MLSSAKLSFSPTTSIRRQNPYLRHRSLLAASLGRAIADPDAHGGSQDFGVRAALIVVCASAPMFGAVDGCNAPAIDANWFDSDHALPLSHLRSRCST
jgi:hypothetical protein